MAQEYQAFDNAEDGVQGGRQSIESAAKWATASKLGIQVLQFAAGIPLARLLSPAEFGAVATVVVVTAFSVILFEMGLGATLVYQRRPSQSLMSAVWWLNALSGLLLLGLLWAIAPAAASFFDQPLLRTLLPMSGLTFAVSLGVVHAAILEKQLAFRKIALIDLSSGTLGILITLALAVAGAGPSALILGQIATASMTSILYILVVRWRPSLMLRAVDLRIIWRFSGGLVGFNLINYFGRNADNFLVAKFWGANDLGLYNRAYNLMLLPVWTITGTVQRVMFPALAAMDQKERIGAAYLRALRVTTILTMPILAGMMATSPALVLVLWGEQWAGVVPLLQVLCVAGMVQTVVTTSGWLFQSQGRTGLMLRVGLVSSAVSLSSYVVSLRWGVVGMAIAVLLSSALAAPIVLFFASRLVNLKFIQILRTVLPVAGCSLAMAAGVWAIPVIGWDRHSGAVLIVQVVIGAAFYAALTRVLIPAGFEDVLRLLSKRSESKSVSHASGSSRLS